MTESPSPRRARERLIAPAILVVSGTSLYVGAALAVGLFEVFSPTVVAWMRMSAAALVLLVIHRPHPRSFIGAAGARAAVYGIVTMLMNMTFYEAISRIPLGTAVAVEFLGPIAVAALGSRGLRDWLSLILAGLGVVVISGASWTDSAAGVIFALLAGAMWAAYIVTGSRIAGDSGSSGTSMTVGFTWAAVAGLPVAIWMWPVTVDANMGTVALLALGLGVLSAVVPYSLDQTVMRLSGAANFALLQSILPLVAAVVGAVVLAQWLSAAEIVGIVLVVAAVVLRRP